MMVATGDFDCLTATYRQEHGKAKNSRTKNGLLIEHIISSFFTIGIIHSTRLLCNPCLFVDRVFFLLQSSFKKYHNVVTLCIITVT